MKCLCNKITGSKDPCSESKLYNAEIALKRLDTWEDIGAAHEELADIVGDDYLFRGQRCCFWGLETQLERDLKVFGKRGQDPREVEGGLIRVFKRQFPQFDLPVPADDNYMEWLAIMRHYGAPTRLLDWTYSFYVALFFAIESATTEAAVWAISSNWIRKYFQRPSLKKIWKLVAVEDPNCLNFNTFKKVFLSKTPFIIITNPYGQNERQVIQQGTFLCPGDIDKSFEQNLLVLADGKPLKNVLTKFVITGDKKERNKILRRLHRMNMNRATLFPDLEGFAQSLKHRMLFPQLLSSDPDWRSWVSKT